MALSQISGTTGIEDATITSIKLADFAAAVDLNGVELILDADQDTSISADTDDTIDIKIAGADDFQFTANTFTALAGSSVVIPDGGLTLASTAVTSTAAELNLLDGVSGLVQADLTKLAAVDATAVELNLIDGGTARGTTALATGDGILINDGGTMAMTNVDTVRTYMEADSLPLAGGTMSGNIVGGDTTISAVNLKDVGVTTNAIGSIGGGTQDIDLTAGNSVSGTVDTSTTTFTFSNPTASDELCVFSLVLVNGGSQTVNFPASVDWEGGTAPTLTTSGTDILVFATIDGGTIWHGQTYSVDSKSP